MLVDGDNILPDTAKETLIGLQSNGCKSGFFK